MNTLVQKVLEMFLDKKRIIGWVSAAMIALGAAYAGMSSSEFKDVVCKASVIEAPVK